MQRGPRLCTLSPLIPEGMPSVVAGLLISTPPPRPLSFPTPGEDGPPATPWATVTK